MNKELTELVSELLTKYFGGAVFTKTLKQVRDMVELLSINHDCHLSQDGSCELCEQLYRTKKILQWFNNKMTKNNEYY
jgi:hypothetical protein